jgi:hypothetical protein
VQELRANLDGTGDIRLAKDALGRSRGDGKPCWPRKIEYDIAGLDIL